MGRLIVRSGGGGGTMSDELSARANQVLVGSTYVGADTNDEAKSGTMPNRGAWTGATTGQGNVTIPAGYHNGSGYVSGSGAYNAGQAAGHTAGVNETKKGNATAGQVLAGVMFTSASAGVNQTGTMPNKASWTGSVGRNSSVAIPAGYHNGSGKVTGPSMTDLPAHTYNPSTAVQTIPVGRYTTGIQTIEKVTVSGITAADIRSGKTLTVKGGTNTIVTMVGTLDTAARWG